MSQQQKVNVDLRQLKNEACICGNKFWKVAYVLKMVPGILLGQGGSATVVPVEFYCCNKCEEPHPGLLPAIAEPKESTNLKIS